MPLRSQQLLFTKIVSQVLPLYCLLLLTACHSSRKLLQKKQASLRTYLQQSAVFNQGFTGFLLYDPQSRQSIYEVHADRHFTPASNTKILTLYLCTEVLGDSIPALQYYSQNDSLFFWGTGDPSFLNPYLPEHNKVLRFLQARPERVLLFSSHNFQDQHFGAGWAWDDYYYDYQAEKSPFPIHGNIVRFSKKAQQTTFSVQPTFFSNLLQHRDSFGGKGNQIIRDTERNIFHFHREKATAYRIERDIPFKYGDTLLISLLQKELPQEVALSPYQAMPPADRQTLMSLPSWQLYQQMMHASDNFVAEQLLLLCAHQLSDTLSVQKALDYAHKNLFTGSVRPRWRDGSGLSRYNLLSPRTTVAVLEKLYRKIPSQKLWQIFPAGGQSGTIKDWYGRGDGQVFVYAKTGSLSHVHCLSGYLLTSSGKTLIFSFMHNNFPGSSRPYKQEMERVLRQIYLDF
ncbi:MAG: D-alanyl-D-alanine carboxypeptidase [Bacteroidota bacterium]